MSAERERHVTTRHGGASWHGATQRSIAVGMAAILLVVLGTRLAGSSVGGAAAQANVEWTSTGISQPVTRFAVSGRVVYALAPVEEERPAALWRGEDGGTNWR